MCLCVCIIEGERVLCVCIIEGEYVLCVCIIKGGEDSYDVLSCRSFFAQKPSL